MPAGTRPRTEAAGASLLIVGAVAAIYRGAVVSYFFNDDFNWFDEAQRFAAANLVHLDRYNHFYRPVVEIYFFAGRALFGCAALPFHLLSVAIHLLNTLLVYLFARDLSGRRDLGFFAALFFCTQPGYYEAVSWVAAITDLLPGLWYLLTLWLFVRFLRSERRWWYAAALTTFTLCLLTHESSATLLPVLIVLDVVVSSRRRDVATRAAAVRYAPFAILLAAFLAIAYTVNSRSYLIREGHYQFGWHAVPHMLQFVLSLYVGPRSVPSYVLIAAVTAVLLWRGSPRVRFAVLFLFATLAPASFFVWGNVSRYLYVPAAAFALLLAEAIVGLEMLLAARLPWRTARTIAAILAVAIAIRFSVYAEKSAWSFRELTVPYERFVAAVRRAHSPGSSSASIALTAADVENIPVAFYDVAAGVAFCGPPLHVVVR
jgi:Dolichyl-phosphate-mannose-protein mannosyltransferase